MNIKKNPADRKIRLLLVTTGLKMGGAEKVVCMLADEMSKKLNFSVAICSLTDGFEVLPNQQQVKIYSLGLKKNIFSAVAALKKYLVIVNEFSPHIIHSHMIHANILCRLFKVTNPSVRLISTAHNCVEGGRIADFMYKITDFIPDLSTNVSQEAVDAFCNRGLSSRHKMIAIPNGVDTNKFRRKPELRARDKKVILNIGRMVKQKNQVLLIDAFEKVLRVRQDVVLKIVGEGPEEINLKKRVSDFGIENHVFFEKFVTDTSPQYNACDLFVLSSLYEGFGLVVAEAMSCEVQVIATDCGGVAEVLGDNGVLVPINNEDALVNAILKQLSIDKVSEAENGSRSRIRIIENFSVESVVERWSAVYVRLIAEEKFQ